MTSLINAILSADTNLVLSLLEQGADVNYNFGKPMLAAFKIQDKSKIEPIVKILVAHGASVDGGLPFDDSPLSLARQLGLSDLFKWMDENRYMVVKKMISDYIHRPVAVHHPDEGCGCDEDVDCGCPNSLYVFTRTLRQK
jgi:hypothetical protein